MKKTVWSLFVLVIFSLSIFSQINSSELKTIELVSPLKVVNMNGKQRVMWLNANNQKYCFSFVTETIDCGTSTFDISFGTQFNQNSDWFTTRGDGYRNKIKSLGKKEWTDNFKIPVVKPYARLKPGEQRLIVFNGRSQNIRATFPNAVTKIIAAEGFDDNPNQFDQLLSKRQETRSNYNPFQKVISGNMYVMRVVDDKNDFYVLFRVDELERGKRCKISWKRIDSLK